MDYGARWGALASLVDEGLEDVVNAQVKAGCPAVLGDAMKYALLGGGQRLRSVLCLESGHISGGVEKDVLPAALAIEMIHAYSLVHDDLPAMDDADTRRGKPSVHKAYGEAVAVLVGDALLNTAFEVLAGKSAECPHRWSSIALEMAKASGPCGIIAGQIEDSSSLPLTTELLWRVHSRKTAGLFRVALRMGALAAGAPSTILEMLTGFGYQMGLAYQIIDDLDDAGDQEGVNVTRVMSASQGKMEAFKRIEEARNHIQPLGDKAWVLLGLMDRLTERAHGTPG